MASQPACSAPWMSLSRLSPIITQSFESAPVRDSASLKIFSSGLVMVFAHEDDVEKMLDPAPFHF